MIDVAGTADTVKRDLFHIAQNIAKDFNVKYPIVRTKTNELYAFYNV